MTTGLEWWRCAGASPVCVFACCQSPKPSISCSAVGDLWLRDAPTASLACSRLPGSEQIPPVRSPETSLLHRGCSCHNSRCHLFLSRAFKAINQFISLGHLLSAEVCFACQRVLFCCAKLWLPFLQALFDQKAAAMLLSAKVAVDGELAWCTSVQRGTAPGCKTGP